MPVLLKLLTLPNMLFDFGSSHANSYVGYVIFTLVKVTHNKTLIRSLLEQLKSIIAEECAPILANWF